MRSFAKKIASMALILLLMMGVMLPVDVAFAEDEGVKLTIVHTNDIHGRIKEGNYDGMGLAKISTKIQEIKANQPNVLVLDAGDVIHGQTIASLSKGESVIKVMNAMGYDGMTPGNHDFNYGQERLVELSNQAEFSILSANVVKEDGSRLLTPYVIKEFEGLKVGIFGLSTPETTYKTHPNNVKGLIFKNPVEEAKEMVVQLKGKVDVIIALSHLGLDESSTYTSKVVAEGVKGIDVIVDGHSHTTLAEGLIVGDTLIVQTGEYDKNLGIVNLTVQDGKVAEKTAQLFTKEEAANIAEDQSIVSIIEDIEKDNKEITDVVVGSTDVKLDGERELVRTGETNLGNLIAEAMLKVSAADIAFTNGGGIRASINVGEITKGEVIEVLPFGNYGVVKEIKGSDIVAALELGVSSYPGQMGAFPHVAGLTFKFDENKEAGNRILEVKVGNEPIEPNKDYKLVTNDFLAVGGDQYDMFKDGDVLAEMPQLDEVVVAYINEMGTSKVVVDGRVSVIKKVEIKPIEKPETVSSYAVQAGDVLWKIAKKFGVTYEKLAEYNKISNPNLILPGQQLLIPQQ